MIRDAANTRLTCAKARSSQCFTCITAMTAFAGVYITIPYPLHVIHSLNFLSLSAMPSKLKEVASATGRGLARTSVCTSVRAVQSRAFLASPSRPAGRAWHNRAVLLESHRSFCSTIQRPDQHQNQKHADSKVWKNADAAVADIKSGSTVLSAGFGLCGTAGVYMPGAVADYLRETYVCDWQKQ